MKRFLAFAAACTGTILTASTALADAAPPWTPGDPVGIPSGAVQDVFIEHEDLSMDLSGVNVTNYGDRASVAILASYTLRNDGPAKGTDIVFVTGSREVTGVQVVLDGVLIPAKVGPLGPVPPSWMPPRGTPGTNGGPDLPYYVSSAAGVAFHINLGAGRHTMSTRYQAMPTVNSADARDAAPVWWQVAFVLSPARQWKGFGGLDVSVRVPTGWQAAVRPGLSRSGDVLTGHFNGIPADSIGVTTRMQMPPDYRSIGWYWGRWGVLVFSILVGLIGARVIRWPWSLGLFGTSLVYAVTLAIIVGSAEGLRSTSVPSAQRSWFGARGEGLDSLFQVPVALVAGFLLGLLGLSIGIALGAAWRHLRVRSTR